MFPAPAPLPSSFVSNRTQPTSCPNWPLPSPSILVIEPIHSCPNLLRTILVPKLRCYSAGHLASRLSIDIYSRSSSLPSSPSHRSFTCAAHAPLIHPSLPVSNLSAFRSRRYPRFRGTTILPNHVFFPRIFGRSSLGLSFGFVGDHGGPAAAATFTALAVGFRPDRLSLPLPLRWCQSTGGQGGRGSSFPCAFARGVGGEVRGTAGACLLTSHTPG